MPMARLRGQDFNGGYDWRRPVTSRCTSAFRIGGGARAEAHRYDFDTSRQKLLGSRIRISETPFETTRRSSSPVIKTSARALIAEARIARSERSRMGIDQGPFGLGSI